jgi:IS30 family transposase
VIGKNHQGTSQCGGVMPKPFYSWERGLNENTKGWSGSHFENITDADVEAVMHKLNHHPRKTLNYQTTNQQITQERDLNKVDLQ